MGWFEGRRKLRAVVESSSQGHEESLVDVGGEEGCFVEVESTNWEEAERMELNTYSALDQVVIPWRICDWRGGTEQKDATEAAMGRKMDEACGRGGEGLERFRWGFRQETHGCGRCAFWGRDV